MPEYYAEIAESLSGCIEKIEEKPDISNISLIEGCRLQRIK
jgi:hypothetical protein